MAIVLINRIVKAHGHLLTETDRKLVSVLQSRPAEAAFWRAQDLTAPLGLHQSAATRLAQRLGFAGYPQLRELLRQDYLGSDGPSQRIRGHLDRHPDGHELQELVQDEVAALSALPQHVRQEELDELAARVIAADVVYLFGQGNAIVLVEQLSRRLRRFGIRSTPLVGSRRDVAERIAAMRDGDVLLAFAFRRMPDTLAHVLDLAAKERIHSTVLTDTLLTMRPEPDSLLAAPRGRSSEFLSLTVPMAICNALVLTIARRYPETALASLDRLGVILEHFET
ncbi:MurR/RpiR family transcriptional regulator [Sediminivirga luteola]|uniref:RpiR family transcriptional regulator n=1 Tax=Sediminivirga luteola TaxID=1774748 RepID=A0A8J2TWF2_9MICO|nr:MurR/RpiR family transcriptional regulator [Sediminivirga luteola]GGA08087.1 RpiR family transcriptional regulator [Sediminivirga luteola]